MEPWEIRRRDIQLKRGERAVRLFQEHVHEYPTRREAMGSIAAKIGCTSETLRSWVMKAEASADPRRTTTLADREQVKQLASEGAELKGANEILRKAMAFFA